MACNSCGDDKGLNKDQVKTLISRLKESGELTERLKSCGGEDVGKSTPVVLCSELDKLIKEAVKDGDLPFVTNIKLNPDGKLSYKEGGENHTIDLGDVIENKFPLGNTIKKGAITKGVYDVDRTALGLDEIEKNLSGKITRNELEKYLKDNVGGDLTKWLDNASRKAQEALADAILAGKDKDLVTIVNDAMSDWLDKIPYKDLMNLADMLSKEIGGDPAELERNIKDALSKEFLKTVKVDGTTIEGNGKNKGLAVKVSSDSGNRLKVRDNGLYYGIEAEEKTRTLYVDSENGDDDNEGSKSNPLRTLKKALNTNDPGENYTIYLHEGQEFELHSSDKDFSGQSFTVYPYGTSVDYTRENNPPGTIHWRRSKELNRPTIKIIADQRNTGGSVVSTVMQTTDGSSKVVTFNGVRFDTTYKAPDDAPLLGKQGGAFGRSGESINLLFCGCEFNLGDEIYLISCGGSSSIDLDACTFDDTDGTNFINVLGVLNFVNSDDNGRSGEVPGSDGKLHFLDVPESSAWRKTLHGVTGVQRSNVVTPNNL